MRGNKRFTRLGAKGFQFSKASKFPFSSRNLNVVALLCAIQLIMDDDV
jgi:hypothetical protein